MAASTLAKMAAACFSALRQFPSRLIPPLLILKWLSWIYGTIKTITCNPNNYTMYSAIFAVTTWRLFTRQMQTKNSCNWVTPECKTLWYLIIVIRIMYWVGTIPALGPQRTG